MTFADLVARDQVFRRQRLSNDALIIALMQQHSLTKLASGDTDFDRVPSITRLAPG